MTWIQTYTGKKFDYINPTIDMIDITDIAHALSNIPRYCGHTKAFYSVAEHCVKGAELMPKNTQLAFLLHDAAEAYIGDIPTPLKKFLELQTNILKNLERKIINLVYEKFKIDVELADSVTIKFIDRHIIWNDTPQVMDKVADNWHKEFKKFDESVSYKVDFWDHGESEDEFLAFFDELTRGKKNDKT